MDDRRKRINRIKRCIIGAVAATILLLCIICLILWGKLITVNRQLSEAEAKLDAYNQAAESVSHNSVTDEILAVSRFDQERLLGESEDIPETDPYYIYLTFDDGPSDNTEDILRVLREYGVKATFFVVGREDETSLRLYEEMAQAGHTVGMHSYSHKYNEIYASEDAFSEDMSRISKLIADTTGEVPVYYRFPGGTSTSITSDDSMRRYIDLLHKAGVEYIDWNIDCGDGAGQNLSADQITANVFRNFGRYHTNVVLLHDGYGHDATVKALPKIIERARNMGAELLPINESTVSVQHLKAEPR